MYPMDREDWFEKRRKEMHDEFKKTDRMVNGVFLFTFVFIVSVSCWGVCGVSFVVWKVMESIGVL